MPKNRFTEFVVDGMEAEQRLDVFLAAKMSEVHSRAHLQKMIKKERKLIYFSIGLMDRLLYAKLNVLTINLQ